MSTPTFENYPAMQLNERQLGSIGEFLNGALTLVIGNTIDSTSATIAAAISPFDPVLDTHTTPNHHLHISYERNGIFDATRRGLLIWTGIGCAVFGVKVYNGSADKGLYSTATSFIGGAALVARKYSSDPVSSDYIDPYDLVEQRHGYMEDFIAGSFKLGKKAHGLEELLEETEDRMCPDVALQRYYKAAARVGFGAMWACKHELDLKIMAQQIQAAEAGDGLDWNQLLQ